MSDFSPIKYHYLYRDISLIITWYQIEWTISGIANPYKQRPGADYNSHQAQRVFTANVKCAGFVDVAHAENAKMVKSVVLG